VLCGHWAAFFGDCDHILEPVVTGHRLVLTYNLVRTVVAQSAPTIAAAVAAATDRMSDEVVVVNATLSQSVPVAALTADAPQHAMSDEAVMTAPTHPVPSVATAAAHGGELERVHASMRTWLQSVETHFGDAEVHGTEELRVACFVFPHPYDSMRSVLQSRLLVCAFLVGMPQTHKTRRVSCLHYVCEKLWMYLMNGTQIPPWGRMVSTRRDQHGQD
jgi:hypothetical protein